MKILNQKVNRILCFLLLILFLSPSPSIANDFLKEQAYNENNFCINQLENYARMRGDRFYVQRDNIYFSKTQILVNIDGDVIPIQHLSCDENGFYTSVKDIETGKGRQETWICKNRDCGYENYVGIDYCGICGRYRYAKD